MATSEVSYDDLLTSVGEFGRFQRVQFVLLNLVAMVGAFHGFNMVFNGAIPDHHCRPDTALIDQCNLLNVSYPDLLNLTIPLEHSPEKGGLVRSRCSLYDMGNYTASCSLPNETLRTTGCQNGWEYSTEYYTSTIVTEWDLVCTSSWKRSMTDTLFFVGRLFGALLFGHLADRYGRKPILLSAAILQAVFGCVTAAMPHFIPFAVLYFLQGAVQCGTFILAFVYVTEIVGPSKRKITAMTNKYFYCLGQVVLAGIAALLRDWRAIELAISLPGFFFIAYIWFVPESGRWLLSKGRLQEGVKVMESIAKMNGKEVSVKALIKSSMAKSQRSQTEDKSKQQQGFKDLFSSFFLAKISLITWFCWLVNSSTYVAMALQTRNLAGNPYINFLMSALVELPALTIALLLVDRLGRKVCIIAFAALAGASCFAAAIISNGWLDTVLVLLAKFGISGSYAIIFLMSAELFPTHVRNMAMGVSAMCGHIGGTLAPLLLATRQTHPPLPMLVFGTLCLLSAVSIIFVPETLGCPLPETVNDLIENIERMRQRRKGDEESPAVIAVTAQEEETQLGITNPAYEKPQQKTDPTAGHIGFTNIYL